jgi:hypothetical protein
MRFEYRNVSRPDAPSAKPDHHLADIDLIFDEPPFAGLRIVGSALWARKDGVPGMIVGLPSRSITKDGGDPSYFQFFKNSKGSTAVQSLKNAILKDFADKYTDVAALAGVGVPVPRAGT